MKSKFRHLVNITSELFLSGGALSSAQVGYEFRPEQIHLAELVAQTISSADRLIAEAGTGTGKSLAYLVPVLLAVGDGKRAVISTHTINLQEQLLHKDIPLAKQVTNREETKVERVLGRNNYLCLRKMTSGSAGLFDVTDNTWNKLSAWSSIDTEGLRGNLTFKVPFWEKIGSSTMDCPGPGCLNYRECFYQKARKRERDADLLIVNHALLTADVVLRRSGGSRLDDFQILVVDEAHSLPAVAVDALAQTYSLKLMLSVLDQLIPAHSSGLAQHWEIALEKRIELGRLVMELRNAASQQHRSLQTVQANKQGRITDRYFAANLIEEPTNNLVSFLSILASGSSSPQKDEMLGIIWQLTELTLALEVNLTHSLPRYVYYAEGLDDAYTLIAKPLDVSEVLRRELWETTESSVAVSATLAVAGKLEFIQKQMGTPEAIKEIIEGGFDFKKQLVIYIPRDLPDPNSYEFDLAVAKKIIELAQITNGGLLCLFTSFRALETTYLSTASEMERLGYLAVKQNDAPREYLVHKMREHGRMALFGTASFWEGIDVPGTALSSLAICRLPFVPPDDPFEEAMREYITERGGNYFLEWSLPQAVIRLRQGVGRLIRRRDDKGIVAIFDSRLHTKFYGKIFIQSLPPGKLVDDLALAYGEKERKHRKHKKQMA